MQESLESARLLAYALWKTELNVVAVKSSDKASAMPVQIGQIARIARIVRPVLERRTDSVPVLHMPGSADLPEDSFSGSIHAAAAHAAAHLRFGSGQADDAAIKPLHQAVLGLLEDARVEALAMQELPGLRHLWRGFHDELATEETSLDALLRRLARALFDPAWKDSHPWVEKGRGLYLETRTQGWAALRRAASILANDIGQMRVRFDAAGYRVQPSYRDDNTHLWQMPEGRAIASPQLLDQADASEASGAGGTGSRAQDDAAALRPLGVAPEWDRLISRYRADWCSLVEMQPREGNPAMLSAHMKDRTAWIAGLARRIRNAASARRRVRARAGGDVDEAALIEAGIALRTASLPAADIHLGTTAVHAPRHIVFILDASVSTMDSCPQWLMAAGARLLDGMAWLTMLACAALEKAGHTCTILAFNSNTRHCVRMQPIKNADEPVSSLQALARLAGLAPAWSTRSGAAVRYAMQLLQGTGGAMIVLVSDGNPHDVDMHDPQYLPEDLRRAAHEAHRCGVTVLGLEVGKDPGMERSGSGVPGWSCARPASLSHVADTLVHAIRGRSC